MSTFTPTFFSLSHDPFTKEVSDADLWLPPSKQGQVEQLVDTLQARHSALLACTGPCGTPIPGQVEHRFRSKWNAHSGQVERTRQVGSRMGDTVER